MSKRESHISILIVPDDGSKSTQFRLSRSLFRLLKALPFVLVFSIVFGAVSYWKLTQTKAIREENARLRAQNRKIIKLARTIEQIKAVDNQLRAMVGAKLELSEGPSRHLYSRVDTSQVTALPDQREIPSIWPAEGRVSAEFGEYKGLLGRRHDGIDIAAASGSPVWATADGKVVFAGWTDDLGNLVIIKHGERFFTRYGHNSKNLVKKGQTVKKGQVIALVGSSGRSTAPHLHYEVCEGVKPVNPRKFLPRKE